MNAARLRNWWRMRRADVAALSAIALAFVLAFGWAVFRGRFLIGGDVFFYTYPMRTVAWRMIRAGSPPTWTPLLLSGYPLLAMAQLGLGYPLTWGHLFLPDHWAEEIFVLAPFLLAPAFTYAYAREIGRSRLASLLAGLAFGYSGLTTNTLGMNGIPTNAMMWLPLLLIALERARTRPLLRSLLGATGAYSLSVLTGHAQSFLLVGLIAVAYALFLALAPSQSERSVESQGPPRSAQARWRPLFVVGLALLCSLGVAAFQILETLRAARRSIRHSITYDFFSQGSLTPREALLSFAAPLYHYIDVTTYIAPLACVVALYAVLRAIRHRQIVDPRIWFWLALACVAVLFMLGEHTPLYRLAFRIPILNLFRIPSRHVFEWSFALAMLAAYGWDALRDTKSAPKQDANIADYKSFKQRRAGFIRILLFALCATISVLWLLSVNRVTLAGLLPSIQSGRAYFTWKIMLTVGVTLVVWRCRRVSASWPRETILASAVMLGCLGEPLVLISQWWPGTAKPAARFTGQATRYLQQFPPEANRVYTHANLGVDENAALPRFDVLDQTALYGLHNAAGYEPLLLERYSRALGDVDYDAVRPRPGHPPPRELFETQSHVLDLLNVTHVVAFSDVAKSPAAQLIEHEGIGFATDELVLELKPGASATISGGNALGDTLAVVTSLANAVTSAQDTPAARLRLYTPEGRIIERVLLAGRDTAEWAHERADVRAVVKHQLAPVFDSRAGDPMNSFSASRYWTRLSLGERTSVSKIEITNTMQSGSLAVWKITLYDAASKQSVPLVRPVLDPTRWQTAAEFEGVLVVRNTRVLPRAWLVAEAESVEGEEALGRIRGESSRQFDPLRTALIEARPEELTQLQGGELSPESAARIVKYEAARLTIETSAPMPTVLVVSEVFYPGWEVSVDGKPGRILLTDYLLRGVVLPAGAHRIEMHYAAPAARNGAIISLLTLMLLSSFVIYSVRLNRLSQHRAR